MRINLSPHALCIQSQNLRVILYILRIYYASFFTFISVLIIAICQLTFIRILWIWTDIEFALSKKHFFAFL